MNAALQLYNAAMTVAAPLAYPFFRAHARGRVRLAERYGTWTHSLASGLWIHGASMGEMQGVLPIISALKQGNPKLPILCTAVSPTGLAAVERVVDEVHLAPFDASLYVERILRNFRPTAFIFTETELWPVLLTRLKRHGVPVHMVNGRISDYTFRRYSLLSPLIGRILQIPSTISVVDTEARERLVALGADPAVVEVCGNTKYDGLPQATPPEARVALRTRLFPDAGPQTRVIVLGSAHPTEDNAWYQAVARSTEDIRLVVVPRHLEKLDQFVRTAQHARMTHRLWTDAPTPSKVVIINVMGLLREMYAVADMAFVGGTFVDVGGHNILEATAQGVPVVVGPNTKNLRELVRELTEKGGLLVAPDTVALVSLVERLNDPDLIAVGARGLSEVQKHRGATTKVLARLQGIT